MPGELDRKIHKLIGLCAMAALESPEDKGILKIYLNIMSELTNIACVREGIFYPVECRKEYAELVPRLLTLCKNENEFPGEDEGPNILKYLLEPPNPFKPPDYQEPLFKLLLFFENSHSVLDTLEEFVTHFKDTLSIADVQRTETGAMRCITNLRFAANTLRDYGLIRDDSSHAFKKLELTLLGLLVADELASQNGRFDLEIKVKNIPRLRSRYAIDPILISPIQKFADPAIVVKRLSAISRENFDGFDKIAKIIAGYCRRYSESEDGKPGLDEYKKMKQDSADLLKTIDDAIDWRNFKAGVRLRVQIGTEKKTSSVEPEIERRYLNCPHCMYAFVINVKDANQAAELFPRDVMETTCPKCHKTVEFSNTIKNYP